MVNIVRRTKELDPISALVGEWSPMRLMRQLLQNDPWGEMLTVDPGSFVPSFELKETKEGYQVKGDVPGVKEKDISIELSGNRLNITGKREEEKKEETDVYYNYERSFGSFARSFTFPEGIEAEKIRADIKDGVLSVFLPKKPETVAKKIQVKSSKES